MADLLESNSRELIMNPIAAHHFYWKHSYSRSRSLLWNIWHNRSGYWRFHWFIFVDNIKNRIER